MPIYFGDILFIKYMNKFLFFYIFLIFSVFSINPHIASAVSDDGNDSSSVPAEVQDVPPSEYFVRGQYGSGPQIVVPYIDDKISGQRITNTEAIGDLAQSERDAQLIYDTALQNGKCLEVANDQRFAILKAGSARAAAKEELDAGGSGGVVENFKSLLGFNGDTNERLAKISEADAAYAKAKADAFGVTGDINQYGQADLANKSAAAYQDTANDARAGVFTGQGAGDSFVKSVLGSKDNGKIYTLLAPIDTFFPGGTIDIAGGGLSGYLNGLYKAGIAIATGLALLMIVLGGLQYVSSDAINGKSEGRSRINNAVIGLLLALGSYILLQQINPNLLRSDLALEATKSTGSVSKVDITLSDGKTAGTGGGFGGGGASGGAMTGGIAAPLTQDVLSRLNANASTFDTTQSHRSCKGTANPDWKSYLRYNIENSGVANLPVSDAAKWFPNGGVPTIDGWTNIMWSIIDPESNFDPLCVFREPAPLNKNSVGLYQLSADDPEAARVQCNEQCLKNPLRNIEIATQILARVVKSGQCVSCKPGRTWKGGGAYWSTLRK